MESQFSDLIARMRSLTQDRFVEANRKALRAAGQVIKDAIVENAPELEDNSKSGTALAPGALKSDVKVSVHTSRDITDSNRVTVSPGKATRHVSLWVETGHENIHGGRSGKGGTLSETNPQTRAHPYIRPAADAAAQQAADAYAEVMVNELRKVMNAESD